MARICSSPIYRMIEFGAIVALFSLAFYGSPIFATAWTLQHTIELNTGGIKGPPNIAILTAGADSKASLLDDDQLSEHLDNVQGAEDYLSKYADEFLSGKVTKPIPSRIEFVSTSHANASQW